VVNFKQLTLSHRLGDRATTIKLLVLGIHAVLYLLLGVISTNATIMPSFWRHDSKVCAGAKRITWVGQLHNSKTSLGGKVDHRITANTSMRSKAYSMSNVAHATQFWANCVPFGKLIHLSANTVLVLARCTQVVTSTGWRREGVASRVRLPRHSHYFRRMSLWCTYHGTNRLRRPASLMQL
jgi:hypothetical protein